MSESVTRFYCHWCDTIKPIQERKMEKDKKGFLMWVGCSMCYKKYLRRD